MRSSLFNSLFKRNITQPDNAEYLEQLSKEHPYFSPAQFYLLQQKQQHTDDHLLQAQKVSVLFNNQYWLNFLLGHDDVSLATTEVETPELIKDETSLTTIEVKQPVEVVIKNEPREEKQEEQPAIQGNNLTTDKTENDQQELSQQQPEEIQPKPVTIEPAKKEELLFEPLHTTDYFASQGIKLTEIQQADKLGKQLKSFTEWLKTMKKINADKVAAAANDQTDTAIQKLAERSNSEDEILTETMADVLIQQGKKEKAIEVYQKLSLLNPSKNAYFAAKIEQLKDN